jgi:hypothetical protein
MKATSIKTVLFLGAAWSVVACGSMAESESKTDVASVSQALTPTQPFVRRNIYDLTPSQRTTLVKAILAFITQPVLDEHAMGHDWHHPSVGELFFTRHHAYLNQLEDYLLVKGFSQFVPIPEWNPADPIPVEFRVADPLVTQAAMNPTPNQVMPAQFADSQLCNFASASALAVALEDWHDGVHGAVGGAMSDVSSAPGAPIFWLWHGFLDDTYHERAWRCEALPALILTIL